MYGKTVMPDLVNPDNAGGGGSVHRLQAAVKPQAWSRHVLSPALCRGRAVAGQ